MPGEALLFDVRHKEHVLANPASLLLVPADHQVTFVFI